MHDRDEPGDNCAGARPVGDNNEVFLFPELFRIGNGQRGLFAVEDRSLLVECLTPLRYDLVDLPVHLYGSLGSIIDGLEVRHAESAG